MHISIICKQLNILVYKHSNNSLYLNIELILVNFYNYISMPYTLRMRKNLHNNDDISLTIL